MSLAKKIAARINPKVRQVADEFAQSKGLKLDHELRAVVDESRAAKIAKEYENLKHTPSDPETKAAYDALINETLEQYEYIKKKTGLKTTPIESGSPNPYKTSADMAKDVADNNHLYYFPTEQGYGTAGAQSMEHPLLKKVKTSDGKEVPANDVFRIVHDYMGHAKEGFQFGAKGEENAFQHHFQMYSPEARKALASETRGQNSWVNYGPKGTQNRANPAATTYAEQKAGILPVWTRELEGNATHYGAPDIKVLDPAFQGTGVDARKFLKTGKPQTPYSSLYLDGAKPETLVTQGTPAKYRASIDQSKLYDIGEDPRGFMKQAQADMVSGNYTGNPIDFQDLARTRIKEAGFEGLHRPDMQSAELFSKIPVSLSKVASLIPAALTAGAVGAATFGGNSEAEAGSKNVRLQRAKLFGKTSQPPAGSDERHFQTAQLQEFARKYLGGMDVVPSGGKIDVKTGKRKAADAVEGVDKPDWRSGNLESQWNPDAITHELAHTSLLPEGIGLKDGQTYMDKQYADVQKQYGYMKQKRSQGEVQPMAAEQLIRRASGLPANTSSVPVKAGEGPRVSVEDPSKVIGTRVKVGDKEVDLIRQSRNLSPENRERMSDIISGKLVFDKDKGWIPNMNAMGAKIEAYKTKKVLEEQIVEPANKKAASVIGGGNGDYSSYEEKNGFPASEWNNSVLAKPDESWSWKDYVNTALGHNKNLPEDINMAATLERADELGNSGMSGGLANLGKAVGPGLISKIINKMQGKPEQYGKVIMKDAAAPKVNLGKTVVQDVNTFNGVTNKDVSPTILGQTTSKPSLQELVEQRNAVQQQQRAQQIIQQRAQIQADAAAKARAEFEFGRKATQERAASLAEEQKNLIQLQSEQIKPRSGL